MLTTVCGAPNVGLHAGILPWRLAYAVATHRVFEDWKDGGSQERIDDFWGVGSRTTRRRFHPALSSHQQVSREENSVLLNFVKAIILCFVGAHGATN